jgi:hypothetical protein
MLTELRINNFAIIDHLELRFPDGLVTFTGETGLVQILPPSKHLSKLQIQYANLSTRFY